MSTQHNIRVILTTNASSTMESLVNQQNFFLGCRVCRQMLKKNNSVFFADFIPDLTMKYSEAFQEITDLDVSFWLLFIYLV